MFVTYYPETVKRNCLIMFHDQFFPDVGSLRQEKVRKYGFSLRPDLHMNTNIYLKGFADKKEMIALLMKSQIN